MSSRTVSIRVPGELLDAAQSAAEDSGMSRNAFIERAIIEWIRVTVCSTATITSPGRIIRIIDTGEAKYDGLAEDLRALLPRLEKRAEHLDTRVHAWSMGEADGEVIE